MTHLYIYVKQAGWQYIALTFSFPNLESVCCSKSGFKCCFLTCIQTSQEAGQVVWYSYLLKNSPQFVVIYTVKGFVIANKAEVDVFLELLLFLWSSGCWQFGSPAFSKSSLNIWNFSIHVLLKPGWRILSITLLVCKMSAICAIVWVFFGIAFLWDWNENWPFPVLWTRKLLSFPNLLAYCMQHFNCIIFQNLN